MRDARSTARRCSALEAAMAASTTGTTAASAKILDAHLRRLARMACDAGVLPEPAPPELGAKLESDFRAFVQIRGNDPAPGGLASGMPGALLDAALRFRVPNTVLHLFRAAIHSRCRPGEPSWAGLLRLLKEVRAYWLAVPRHRNPVFARDGWRCSVPGCSSRRNLHDHHVRFRSQGGGGEQDNRVAVCAAHHHHGLHRGFVRAAGKASAGLEWALGCTRGGHPLLRISGRGEVYLA